MNGRKQEIELNRRIVRSLELTSDRTSCPPAGKPVYRRRLYRLVPFIFILCTSCVPFYFETYYRPEAPTGVVTRGAHCGGPSNRIEFVVDGIKIGHGAFRAEPTLQIAMIFHVPENKTVLLQDTQVHIRVPGDPAKFRAQFTEAVLGGEPGPPRQPADQPMIGGTKIIKGVLLRQPTSRPFFYVLQARVDMPDAGVLIVKLPPFEVNGRLAELPEITLSQEKHFDFLQPINC